MRNAINTGSAYASKHSIMLSELANICRTIRFVLQVGFSKLEKHGRCKRVVSANGDHAARLVESQNPMRYGLGCSLFFGAFWSEGSVVRTCISFKNRSD